RHGGDLDGDQREVRNRPAGRNSGGPCAAIAFDDGCDRDRAASRRRGAGIAEQTQGHRADNEEQRREGTGGVTVSGLGTVMHGSISSRRSCREAAPRTTRRIAPDGYGWCPDGVRSVAIAALPLPA